jgi:hypothetical protein
MKINTTLKSIDNCYAIDQKLAYIDRNWITSRQCLVLTGNLRVACDGSLDVYIAPYYVPLEFLNMPTMFLFNTKGRICVDKD